MDDRSPAGGPDRRRVLTYLVAAPVLTVAAPAATAAGAAPAAADEGGLSIPDIPDFVESGDALILAAKPTSHMLVLEITEDNRVRLELPRAETGQGITTGVAMMVAEDMDARLADVEVPLSDARPELLFNQLTGGSNATRAQWDPVRKIAAAARARLVTAAARRWNVPARELVTRDTMVIAPDGRRATFGSLSAAAAKVRVPAVSTAPKPADQYTLIGTHVGRIDTRAIVTGTKTYTLDVPISAKPTVVRRPPTLRGTVVAVRNEAAVRRMPGVVDVAVIPTGVAVMAETFGQAIEATEKLEVTWGPGAIDGLSDADIRAQLRAAAAPLGAPPAGMTVIDAEFDFAGVSHAPMETESAIADVRADRAEIWSSLYAPVAAQKRIASELGLRLGRVRLHVTQGGGSFGRRLLFDAALEAAQISQRMRRPVKLMWPRVDDMRHGHRRPALYHRARLVLPLSGAADAVGMWDHRVASEQMSLEHGAGDALTAAIPQFADASFTVAAKIFELTQKNPYTFAATQLLTEAPIKAGASSWRSVYSGTARVVQEIMVDEAARKLGVDPAAYRRRTLKNARHRAVVDKLVEVGGWGRSLPRGHAQGIGFHAEFRSAAAYLVEIDARDPNQPRVIKAVIVADVGRAINPNGVKAQLQGCLVDGISTILYAGLHIKNGLPVETSFGDFRYARMKDTPPTVDVHLMPPTGQLGGVGELGMPAASAAVANAYARATGTRPRQFPILPTASAPSTR